jgi:hypothetical protein
LNVLKVRAVAHAMVPNYAALDAGSKRFIGRKAVVSADGVLNFELDGVHEIAEMAEYKRSVRDGDLEAADAETAALCGVKFNAPKVKEAVK